MFSIGSRGISFDLIDKGLHVGEKILWGQIERQRRNMLEDPELTLKVASILRTSPTMTASEKSTLVFHNCVRNARRNWRALYLCRIS